MDVNAVNYNTATTGVYDNTTTTAATAANEDKNLQNPAVENEAAAVDEAAVYEPSKETAETYKPDIQKIKQMWAEHDSKVESFRRLVEGLFNKQAQKADTATGWFTNSEATAKASDEMMVEVDEATRAAAQKEIEEGGYYSVEETAKRLLDFAVALSGGDPSKIETLKKAVEDGFKAAEEVWGDELPEISQKTYEAVMQGFDEWEKAGSASAITLLK